MTKIVTRPWWETAKGVEKTREEGERYYDDHIDEFLDLLKDIARNPETKEE